MGAVEMPPFRSRPPYVMSEMIAAEPALAERLVRRLAKDERSNSSSRRDPRRGRRGPSDRHDRLRDVRARRDGDRRAASRGARPAGRPRGSLGPGARAARAARSAPGSSLAVSHEGGTHVTNEAIRAARAAGRDDGADHRRAADRPARPSPSTWSCTEEQDQSWCHTVGYLAPLVVGRRAGGEAAPVAGRRRAPSAPSSTSARTPTPPRRSRRRWPAPIG